MQVQLIIKKFDAIQRAAPEVKKGIGHVRLLGPDQNRLTLVAHSHFDRNGSRLCDCCVRDAILNGYTRIRQLNLDGKTYIIKYNKSHGYTKFDDDGKPRERGVLTHVLSEEVLRTAQIFEIDRSKVDRTDLTNGQRALQGTEMEELVKRILNNEGEILEISEVKSAADPKWQLGFYLSGEEHPGCDSRGNFTSG